MKELTLVVLAAGMGKRFGTRIKQLEPLGPNGELLIDYSVDLQKFCLLSDMTSTSFSETR